VNALHDRGIFTLWDAKIGVTDSIGRSEWKLTDLLELEGERAVEWEGYIKLLYFVGTGADPGFNATTMHQQSPNYQPFRQHLRSR
jgi:hypothetical protein